MTDNLDAADPLFDACAAVLREVAGYEVTHERLEASLPTVRGMIAAIRLMDELDLDVVEPMTAFRCPR